MPRDLRVNERIRVKQIRLIDANGQQVGVVPLEKGLELAGKAGLDLVEVAPLTSPPVCRIMDYSKYKYDQERKERQAKKHQKTTHLKEIRIRPNIEKHDYLVKVNHLKRFLSRGDKAKITLRFRGREMVHLEQGKQILDRFANEIGGLGCVEKEPVLEGRVMTMNVAPK